MRTEPYDFDTLIDRTPWASAKWSRRTEAEVAAGVMPLSVADMEFACAPEIVSAVEAAARFGVYGYTDADARYYDAVTGWMRTRHGFAAQAQWIVPIYGVVPAMCVAVRALCKPGEAVLLQAPGYGPFTMAIESNGCVPVYSPLTLGADGLYRMDLEDLERKAARPDVRMMFLCSPHNPVGRVWTVEELRAVADICARNGVLVFSDEIHCDLVLHGRHTVFCDAAPEMADRCIIATAPSKTFNLAGMQQANVIIPDEGVRAAFRQALHAGGYSNVSFFGYQSMVAAYTQAGGWLDAMLAYVRDNFALLDGWLARSLPQVKLLPVQGTYLAWTDWRALGLTGEQLSQLVRGEAMLVLAEGPMFGAGGEGFMRMNLALPRAELQRALDRLLAAARGRGIA